MTRVSEFAQGAYGIKEVSNQTMINYGYALLAIAGGDGKVSEAEMQWLVNHQRRFGAPEEVIKLYGEFDYRNADLDKLLPDIKVDREDWVAPPHLVYHAILMSSADGVYAEKERAKVKQAAERLGVSGDTLLAIHSLIEMEQSVKDLRKALLHVETTHLA